MDNRAAGNLTRTCVRCLSFGDLRCFAGQRSSCGEDADETGIIVAGKDGAGRGYVLADRSGHYTPTEWAQLAIALYRHCAPRRC
jgi:hypothetical protein